MKTLIIEDEERSRILLRNQARRYCPQLDIVAEGQSIEQAAELIERNQPDLVFLDIHLGDRLIFELLEGNDNLGFRIIFVTAHSEFAVQAFQYDAVHYILKPIEPDKLMEAVNRVMAQAPILPATLQQMVSRIGGGKASQRLAIPSVSSMREVIIHITHVKVSLLKTSK